MDNWRGLILNMFGYSPYNPLSVVMHGLMYFLPVYIVTLVAGGIWEVLFATVRKHDVNEGFFVSSMLFALSLPPSIPLCRWPSAFPSAWCWARKCSAAPARTSSTRP